MTTFYLVRHGQKEERIGDPPLSLLGQAQARTTAEYLSRFGIAAIFASPLKRAVDTAAIIASALALEFRIDSRLRERANWGDQPSQSFEDFLKMWEYASLYRDAQPPVGDSARKCGERLEMFIRDVSRTYPESAIIAVTHGGTITDFLVNVFPEGYLQKFSPLFPDQIKECSITEIGFDGKQFHLRRFADAGHLKREET